MAQTQANVTSQSFFDTSVPAHLIIGSQDEILDHTHRIIQSYVCPNDGCQTCRDCLAVRDGNHHALLWIDPEKQYTRDDLTLLFAKVTFKLESNERFFFVLNKADALNTTSANSLLKTLEEPPRGYYFLLLAQRLDGILPTIRSRCTLHQLESTQTITHQALFDSLIYKAEPLSFLSILDASKITERESIALIDTLLAHTIELHKSALTDNNPQSIAASKKRIGIFTTASLSTPMPGSSKLFWKNIYLQVNTA